MPEQRNGFDAWMRDFVLELDRRGTPPEVRSRMTRLPYYQLFDDFPNDIVGAVTGALFSMGERAPTTPETVRFRVYLEQDGEGCDYTIGCGRNLFDLQAQNRQAALAEIERMIFGSGDENDLDSTRGYEGGDAHIVKALLIPVNHMEAVPLAEMGSRAAERSATAEAEASRARDVEEFERLRQRLGR